MTTTEPTTSCPPPTWVDLRDTVPEIRNDLLDLWARVEHDSDLRWLVEHLGRLIEAAAVYTWLDVVGRATEATDPVFCPDEWRTVAPGRWEHEAVPYEASVTAQTWLWRWNLWRRNDAGDLVLVDHGTAHTLNDAQRQADRRAQRDRNWRAS